MATRLPTGSLVITVGKEGPHWEGKWRHDGRQIKRRLGPAWLDPGSKENAGVGQGWKKRPGRPTDGFLSREDAIVALRSMIARQAAEERQENRHNRHTFAEAAEAWYQRAIRRQRKPSTLLSYRQGIDAYILGTGTKRVKTPCPFKDKPIDAVSKRDMQAWFDSMEHSRTKERLHKLIKGITLHALREEWVKENVATAVECHVVPYDGDLDFYSVAEVQRLIDAAEDAYDAALYATAAFTGLRRGELLALQWGDIDFKHSRLTVRRNVAAGVMSTPKSGRVRTVPMVPALSARLKLLKLKSGGTVVPVSSTSSRNSQQLGDAKLGRSNGNHGTTHVFANPARLQNGNPWPCPRALERRYKKTLNRAGLRKLPFHSLRHHFGSQAVNVATLVQVKAWMGHADLRTTGRYLHAKNLDSDAGLLAAAF